MSDVLLITRSGPGDVVARVTMTRPEVRNAFNAELIGALHEAFAALGAEPAERLRVVVLDGEGKAFSAGADIAWQRAALELSMEENEADAARLQAMLDAIDRCPVPVIVRAHGAVLGGGMGLCSVADIVLADAGTLFGFTETKLGILPAIISPFVLARIGEGNARALFPSGERFGADRARQIGLVHEVCADATALDARVEDVVGEILGAGPTAVREAKLLIRAYRDHDAGAFSRQSVRVAARQRISAEGQDGLRAFLEKRSPSWRE